MISKIDTYDGFLQVTNPVPPYVNNYSGNVGVGNVRYNPGTQNLEAYDGSSWIPISGQHMSSTISLSGRAQAILIHAEKQMLQDEKFNRLAKDNPTIADALASYREAAERLQVVISLCEE